MNIYKTITQFTKFLIIALLPLVVSANELWKEPQSTEEAIYNPDLYAWKLFVALNWPADMVTRKADPNRKFGENDYVVWESWKLSSGPNDEVFIKDGKDPGEWVTGSKIDRSNKTKSFEDLPLQQMILRSKSDFHVKFDPPSIEGASGNENHLNKEAYEFIRTNELYHIGGQEKLFEKAKELRAEATKKYDNSGVIPEIHQYKKKLIDFPVEAKEVKAQWRVIEDSQKHKYRWHKDEATGKVFGLTALHITTKDLPNWLWATFEHVDNPSLPDAEDWIVASNDSSATSNGYPNGLGIEGTFWENYRLRGTQIDFTDPTGKPTILANSQIEKGFQTTSSCITCHAMAAIGSRVDKQNGANRLAIFQDVHLIKGKDAVVMGPVGSPDYSLFETNVRLFLQGEVVGDVNYIQTDFVWSLMRAKRKPE
ncbi:hypothetical protein [Nitrosomonas ureae]|uniref:Uncharacterized protein n=1 Tax=Nitrosomonas ureae TaxID=44577 RepID=A0A2T5IM16_9PROT|nr:hypothetical protein [Nitrosomonas ureae]PTQ84868.1 hypothetical protein C8R28_101672 [Nitrosomonas ureae]